MNIYNNNSVIKFYKKRADAKIPLKVWYEEVEQNKWKSPNQLKQHYGGSISILKNSRVVFDIKENDYRLVAAINYEHGWIFIKFIGTHGEYDRIDADKIGSYKPEKNNKSQTNNRKQNGSRNSKI